jgi:hypothetical protein
MDVTANHWYAEYLMKHENIRGFDVAVKSTWPDDTTTP